MPDHKKQLLENAEKIVKDGILNREAIDFYADIFDFQSATGDRWKEPASSLNMVNPDDLPLKPEGLRFDTSAKDILAGSFSELCSIIIRHNPGLDTSKATGVMTAGSTVLLSAIDHVMNKDTDSINAMASSAGMGFEEYLFLLVNWLKPLFTSLRERYAGADPVEYRDRTCPFCGYYPDMGILSAEKQGKRFLRCGLCENIWMYRRLSCAICGEGKAEKLEYFMPENNDRYRVDACNTCGGYLKSVCLGKFEELKTCDLTIENLLTMSLDSEMLGKGYGKQ